MLIGTWDISEADARQWNVTPGYHSISNDSEWARGHPIPVLFKNEIGFKTLKIVLLIKANGRQDILKRCSQILSHLLEPVELTLDGFEHKFCGILQKHTHSERVMNRWHTFTLEFECYEFSDEIVQKTSGTTDIVISNPGNILTPAVIEIAPQIGTASTTLTGICRDRYTGTDLPVTIKDLETGKVVVLDGETGLITQDGTIKSDIEAWDLPSLIPGDNKITVTSNRMDIAVRFRPRFM